MLDYERAYIYIYIYIHIYCGSNGGISCGGMWRPLNWLMTKRLNHRTPKELSVATIWSLPEGNMNMGLVPYPKILVEHPQNPVANHDISKVI